MEVFNKLAINQFHLLAAEALKKDKSGIELPANLAELMYQTMCERVGEPLQKVSVRDILVCEIPLPFMPDKIDYKIGKGCCDEIIKRDGLFVPCSHHCDGSKCSKHLKERSGCGDYWERYAAWQKKEPYCVEVDVKKKDSEDTEKKLIKEKPYSAYLHSKKLDSTAVEDELQKWGIELRLDSELFRAPAKPVKKNRGRKTELKVEAAESDEETESDSEKDSEKSEDSESEPKEEPEEKPKEEPKKKAPPKPRMKKALGTPLDGHEGELVKEEMEKAPKKGKFKGKPENLKDAEHDGTEYKVYAGKFYDKDTLELVAWTNKGEFTLI